MIVGLTGGIATGKSNVSAYLNQKGFYIVDADKLTHSVQSKGQPGLHAMIQHFGKSYLNADQTLNRRKLGHFVFTHPSELQTLVRIIDPYIRKAIIAELKLGSKKSKHIVLDAPTLFENGYQYLVDKIIVVSCDPMHQLKRVMKRDHLSISNAEARIDSQWPLSVKETLADWVINSDGSKQQTLSQVKELVNHHQI